MQEFQIEIKEELARVETIQAETLGEAIDKAMELYYDQKIILDAEDMKKTVSIADRKEAIRTACMLAEKGDVILVAGKGHENYQEIKGVKHHFDDKEVLKEIFK